MRSSNRCPTPAKRIEDNVALVAARLDDALKQCDGLLGGIA
jgi:hypothetical protein